MNISLLVSNIQKLCDEHGVTVNRMLQECGLHKSVVDHMKNEKPSIPSIDKILPIAEYFNVSVDYLLGYAPNEQQSNNRLKKLITFAEKLTDEQIDTIIAMGTAFLDSKK